MSFHSLLLVDKFIITCAEIKGLSAVHTRDEEPALSQRRRFSQPSGD